MARRGTAIVTLATSLATLFAMVTRGAERDASAVTMAGGADAWRMLVMDPLSDQLACDCVAGYARRNYGKLAEFLGERWHRRVELVYAESFSSPRVGAPARLELIAGKFSEVVADAARAGIRVRSVAMLTSKDGSMTQTGLFVVRQGDPARSVQDLKGHRLLLGPEDAAEKHSAAAATLEAFRLPVLGKPAVKASCSAAALAVAEKEADAAVVSSYAMPLLEGCGTIDKGTLRVVGKTDPVPFIGLFITERVGRQEEQDVAAALAEVRDHPALLTALESRDGFVRVPPLGAGATPTPRRGRIGVAPTATPSAATCLGSSPPRDGCSGRGP